MSGRSSPQSVPINEYENCSRKYIDISPSRKIKIAVVDSHNEVLTFIYRSIGAKKIPYGGLKLVHVDSHPDLCIPNIPSSAILSQPYEILRQLDIENWILPSIFAQHIDHIIWLHPPWSKQLTNRRPTRYFIGRCKASEHLAVNIPEPYFYNEGIYAHRGDMESLVPFTLTVAVIHETNTTCNVCTDITSELINKTFILDIDLDAFSTKDPFCGFYTADQFALIDKLFTPPRPPQLRFPPGLGGTDASTTASVDADLVFESASLAAKVVCEAHRANLAKLLRCMRTLAAGVPVVDAVKDSSTEVLECDPHEVLALTTLLLSLKPDVFSSRVYTAIQISHSAAHSLVQQLAEMPEIDEIGQLRLSRCSLSAQSSSPEPPKEKQQRVDEEGKEDEEGDTEDMAMMVHLHDLWKSLADRENYPLPQHVSTREEQEELMWGLESLLNRLHNPCLITVARSVGDNYTPAEQIADLQVMLFESLKRIYGVEMFSVVLDYDGATEDAATLRSMGFEVTEVRGETPAAPLLSFVERHIHCEPSECDTRDIA